MGNCSAPSSSTPHAVASPPPTDLPAVSATPQTLSSVLKTLGAAKGHLVSCHDAAGVLMFISDSVSDILGFSPAELIGRAGFKQGKYTNLDYFRSHKNGSAVRFKNVFHSVSDAGETVFIERAVENTASLNLLMGPDGSLLNIPKEISQVLGTAIGDVPGARLADLLSEKDMESVQSNLKCTQGDLKFCSTEVQIGGKAVPLEFYGHVDGNVVVVMPNSLRNNAGVTNIDMENLVKDIVDNGPLPIYSVDGDGVIIWANRAMIRMMGYEDCPEKYLGTTCHRFFPDQVCLANMFEVLKGGGHLKQFPCILKRRDGALIHVLYDKSAKFDDNGNFKHTRCFVRDVTETVQLKEEAEAIERERALAREREARAVHASSVKTQFLATMSHEIRTPINGILGMAGLLRSTAMTEEQNEFVNSILICADSLLSLVNNILDISKIELGMLELNITPINIETIVRNACTVLKIQASENNIGFETRLDDSLVGGRNGWVMGDANRLTQILLNFLSNAVKFTSHGSVRCNVFPEAAGDAEDVDVVVVFEISDTGIGIEDTSKLFQPFQQATRKIAQDYGGTGLGLSISKELITCMGGTVDIVSKLGEGTTICAKVPFRRSDGDFSVSATPLYADRDNISSSSPLSSPLRVLVVDDNAINRKVVVRMLKNIGYSNVVVASDGQQALDLVMNSRNEPFDLIFMDCLMPEMNGWEATLAIRAFERRELEAGRPPYGPGRNSRICIIALTANATLHDREYCLEVGMDDFLTKPVTIERIEATVKARLGELLIEVNA